MTPLTPCDLDSLIFDLPLNLSRSRTDPPVQFARAASAERPGRRGRARRLVISAIALTSILAVHGMVSYWLKSIPYDQATFHDYLNSFIHWRGHPTYYG